MEKSEWMQEAKRKVASARGRKLSREERSQEAVELAALLLDQARHAMGREEKDQLAQLARMMDDPQGKAFTISIVDQCFRSSSASRIVSQLLHVLNTMGTPKYLNREMKLAFKVFRTFGKWFPWFFVPLIKGLLRKETSAVILPGESKPLSKHMKKRHKEGVRVNLNHLGEAILGEDEANKRLQIYLSDLANPEVEYISVKVSTIFSQINVLAWNETVDILAARLRQLFEAAESHLFRRHDGVAVPKFVNLDMEEYRDLRLTVEVFKKVLEERAFKHHSAGIVLQSYLPDSLPIQMELTEWAMNRVADGGAPIKIRIVKGANLAMEQVEASLKNWPQAPYPDKHSVDANFKRMVEYGMQKKHASSVLLGIGSHNLFDIAYAHLLSAENEVEDYVCFEMLEGMADHIRRAVQQLTGDMLLYCPAATKQEFQYALAYLVRRLDENTAPENFLRHIFDMSPGTKEWDEQVALFTSAAADDNISFSSRRTQNRNLDPLQPDLCAGFENETDTDWVLPQNQLWAHEILTEWQEKTPTTLPICMGKDVMTSTYETGNGTDPSRPGKTTYKYCLADIHLVEQSLKNIKQAEAVWQATTPAERSKILAQVAQTLRVHRKDLLGVMVATTGKTLPEADAEVSEAIDFAEYYRRNTEEIHGLKDIHWKPKGTVLVAPPWNFPCSIPAGGILAALATGNCVIFKPAPEAVYVGWVLVQALWKAGISKDVLHFLPCNDEPAGSALVNDKRVNAVILTGATETAQLFLKMRPDIDLLAETGGKNAIIVSAASDRDLAIKDIIHSAFGHAGQKCSACSLAILEAEVYDDPHFRAQLVDAARSLPVGSAWEGMTKVNPLIRPPSRILMRGLTQLDEGEEWLLQPQQDLNNPHLWSPGIKLGVQAGSFTHQTELFGPVLGIMRADSVQHAIALANGTRYGLTAGLQSLDEREKVLWLDEIEAGNCYVNRTITGAIVQRQPFGGCKDSSFGPGAKAGGPNYLMQLMRAEQDSLPTEREKLNETSQQLSALAEKHLSADDYQHFQSSQGSYTFFWVHYFSKDHDSSLLIGQDNIFRYRPVKKLCVRLQSSDGVLNLWKLAAAASAIDMSLEISFDPGINAPLEAMDQILPKIIWTAEGESVWVDRVIAKEFRKVRLLSAPQPAILDAFADAGIHFQISPILANGRVELLKYLREISISSDYHRYGNVGLREKEKRRSLTEPEGSKKPFGCGLGGCCC